MPADGLRVAVGRCFADLRVIDQRLIVDRQQIGAAGRQCGHQQRGDTAETRPDVSAFHVPFLQSVYWYPD
jgi:hypothetical protein